MDFIFDWEAEGDRFSFEDSDRFEEDSLCSWISEPESLCNNWRGWRKPNGSQQNQACGHLAQNNVTGRDTSTPGQIPALVELVAQAVACHIPFEIVEHFYPPIPEQLQLRIAFWSFPESEEDIRLYSCLANGSADEFQKGESLFKSKAVNDALQIGFHLSATVTVASQGPAAVAVNGAVNPSKGEHKVALVFDRRHITSCSCSCANGATWCAHVVALCLFRIHQPNQVKLRAPVSESLSRLERDQLQKFAQYLISALPQQLLPIAQRLLDDLLSSQQSDINTVCGAPDPTAGPAANEQTTWCLNEGALHENIKKTLSKFCVPSPMVLSDVNFLTNSAPPAATEWQTLLRPLRGREPEGIWNLLSIVREMFRRNDANAVTLLEIITDELLGSEQIVSWWFNNKTAHHHSNASLHGNRSGGVQTSGGGSGSAPLAAAGLCDEIVTLWRLAALNPSLTLSQRNELSLRLSQWQSQCIDKLCKLRPNNNNTLPSSIQHRLNIESLFPGFMPAIEACQLDWSDLSLPGGVADLLRWCSHWGHVSGSWVPSRCVTTSSASAGTAVVSSNQKVPVPDGDLSNKEESSVLRVDLLSNSRMREAGRKVLMPSERSPHSTLRPISSSSASSGRKYDTDDVDGGLSKTMAECNVNSDENSHPVARLPGQEDSKRGVADVISTDELSQQKQSDLPLLDNGACSSLAEQNAVVKDNKQEVLFALAEALHAHGHTREACRLARQLAEEMLATDAVTVTAAAPEHSTHHKDKSKKLTVTSFASSTLAKVSFLCTVLLEDPENRHLAFRIGLYGMEMPRPPAASKSLEVKLAHQEYELASVLKKLTLGPAEVAVIRDRAERLRDGKLKMRGDALLPITLASFIFDSLCVSQSNRSVASASQMTPVLHLAPQDEKLGFEAAVAALGLKANVSEAEHPLLCEGTRRQKGELAVTMLVQYKDDPAKLHRIMDKLLDKEMHQLYKALPHDTEVSNYFGSNLSSLKLASGNGSANRETFCDGTTEGDDGYGAETADVYKSVSEQDRDTSDAHASGCRAKVAGAPGRSNADDMAVDDDTEGSGDYKAWEAKFRCTNLKSTKKHSVGMASIDSSAPETTSSDNSPTLVRRNILSSVSGTAAAPLHAGPGSDSGSSHSDSVDSSSSGCKQSSQQQQQQQLRNTSRLQPKDTDCTLNILESSPQLSVYNRSLPAAAKGSRYKGGKSRIMPVLPNQPSEASAHFMFELAKTVLIKAGGNSSTSMFVNQSSSSTANNSQSGPHRALHLCAFQIGLYALGLHNCVNTNWLSRTYSSHVSWIAGQAMEIGYPAIEILIKTWEGHLTPQEAASLADKASRCRDPHMVRAAAELALSCLKHAHALNPPEIQRALLQCKEQSSDMLQRACLSIESMAKDGVVCSDTLFEVAKRWYELYEESSQSGSVPVQPARSVPVALAAAAAATATVPTSITSFQSVNDSAMGVPAAVAPPTAQDGITLLQLAPSSVAPHGTLGPYPPGTVSFVPPQPIQIVPHPYGQYTYVHQIPGANQASAPQHRQWYSLPLQHNGQPMNLVRYPYQASPYIAANPPVPGMALPPPTPQQLAAVSPAYLPQGMQGMPAAIYHSARPPPVHVTYLPSAAALPARYGGGTSAALLNDATAVAASVNSVIEPGAMMHHVNAGQQLQSQQPMQQQQQQQLAGDEVQAAAGAVAVIGNETVHNNYLLATFRVGMMAMDALAKRVHDDRPNLKFSRNPSYGEDVKWLQGVACKLGTSYLQQFCVSVVNTIVSPFILFDIAMESANYLARNSMGQASQQIRLPMINSLLQKCLQMFGSCAQAKLHHITPSDYDDFVSIVCSARNAFCMVPGGMTQFNEMLQSLRRSKYCKKDLWQRVISGLHSTNNV